MTIRANINEAIAKVQLAQTAIWKIQDSINCNNCMTNHEKERVADFQQFLLKLESLLLEKKGN